MKKKGIIYYYCLKRNIEMLFDVLSSVFSHLYRDFYFIKDDMAFKGIDENVYREELILVLEWSPSLFL